ncbi:uncharacterized protein A1O5_08348 [Cladophialophora psammophila CBS 110553]|uniref:Uncharacterized protein n=1 Tax=Cladophialophora psammophila CBS 110553 TaxID=1182543 RepID=W9WU48_9EURO|nr:uncharacterized protein A1O5_08348 [Cladophialophora psammophila CBS 110553]EXJ68555.1 hypothetical protein A1O5_08348 [Cladophialophora psammophila CBS 110553]
MATAITPSRISTASLTASLKTTITRPAELRARQIDTICGYASTAGVTYSLYCPDNVPCVTDSDTSPALAYCSYPGALPISTAIAYGYWPDYDCAITPLAGYMCCGDVLPNPGYYYWDSGATIGAACMPAGVTSMTAVKALGVATSNPASSVEQAPTTTQPPQPPPSESDGLSTTAKIGTVVGTIIGFFSLVVTIVIGIIGCKKKRDNTTWTQAAKSTKIIGCCNSSRAGDDHSRNSHVEYGPGDNYHYDRVPGRHSYPMKGYTYQA